MPIYEFVCRSCDRHFDELVPSNWREAGIACPNCQSKELERAVSRVGGFSSGGKMHTADSGHACGSCSTGGCSTCH